MPGKLLTYIAVRPSAAPLVPQPPNPDLRRVSLSGDTPYHEIRGNVERKGLGHDARGLQILMLVGIARAPRV